ncbi:MAG: phospho-sugar mutase [Clostridia bacterium]|nr:phospho-sugar mutase [Clostridia bacterium]
MDYKTKYNKWLNSNQLSKELKQELQSLNEQQIIDVFYKNIEFGTGGMRGVMGVGTNRINSIMIKKATLGYANFLLKTDKDVKEKGIVIAHDNRKNARLFTLTTAGVFASMGIKTYIFNSLRPTPLLSFAIRYLNCSGGVIITASHNPKQYNGYKLYNAEGCQLVTEHTNKIFEEIEKIEDELNINCNTNSPLIKILDDSVDKAYEEMVLKNSLDKNIDTSNFKIVFSPQHGASYVPMMNVLQKLGYQVYNVKEQSYPSETFENTKSPNPEEQVAYEKAIELGKSVNADLMLTTDPDGDRVGIVILDKNKQPVYFNGNQTAALLIEYILNFKKQNNLLKLPSVIYTTIVTSPLGEKIAKSYDVDCEKTLTGFKYIGDKIEKALQNNGPEFIIGYEESYGYLIDANVRDKDSIQSALLIAEMTCYYKQQNLNLCDALENIYKKYGYYCEGLKSIYLEGQKGAIQIAKFMETLRNSPYTNIANEKLIAVEDYVTLERKENDKIIKLDMEQSNVLRFILEEYGFVAIRPSGTEPKCKFYFSVFGKTKEEAQEKFDKITNFIMSDAERILKELN